jgi:NitT/TauT family transport system substrate-binding protein
VRSNHLAHPVRPARGLLLVLLPLALLMAACGSSDDGGSGAGTTTTSSASGTTQAAGGGSADPLAPQPLAEPVSVTLAMPGLKAESWAAAILADQMGEFEKENLDLEVVLLPFPDIIAGMLSDQVQVFAAGFNASIFNAMATGADLKFAAATGEPSPEGESGLYVRTELANPDGTVDPCALEGKNVSMGGTVGFGSVSVLWTNDFLAQCDLTLDDINLVLVGGPDLVLGLETGSVDAGFLPDPFWKQVQEDGTAVLAAPTLPVSLGGYLFNSFLEDEPEAAEAVLRAMLRTVRDHLQGDYHADPAVMAVLAEQTGIPVDVMTATPSLVFPEDMKLTESAIVPLQEIWLGVGDMLTYTEPIPASEMFDESLVQSILAG